ncbi:hypothetical protein E1B28_011960 [Marasmius oreades]|uniref:Protein kinase domain-containing protein n=1 Tax=Marasmius oreades TaxID=181124 RepID=A0A9P7RQH2_9AGAR|nr:uncharacterized protein E1B28_011960 [Marasmius oreades]KAG7087911.1 hypothetical protein E1B28_011960 [Marasmius oreades]
MPALISSADTMDTFLSQSEEPIPLGAVHGVIHSHRYREKLSEMLDTTENPNFAKVYEATAKDEQKVADLFERIVNSKMERRVALALRGADAESFMDALQLILDENIECSITQNDALKAQMRGLLIQLSKLSTGLPESMFISGVEPVKNRRYLGGTFGDVYRSMYNGKPVALKMLRMFQNQAERSKIYKRFCKEASIWQGLKHEFVLPLLGIDAENFPRQPCMVSPWMMNGTLVQFLRKNPRSNLDRLLYQIIQGIDYLHSQEVVHGDLKGGNILIDERCRPRLADFGLTVFAEATMQSTTDHGGTLRWMAPELLYPHGEPQRRSYASDIYAFACVCVEVYTGKCPFAEIPSEGQVITQLFQGARPKRPEKISDSLWKIVTHCWQTDKAARPRSHRVVDALSKIKNTGGDGSISSGTWDTLQPNADPMFMGRHLEARGPGEASSRRKPFTPFTSPQRSLLDHTMRWLDQDIEDEFSQCLKCVRHHADPYRMYYHAQPLQQNSSVSIFTVRMKGTSSVYTVKQIDFRQPGLTKHLSRLIDEFHDMRFLPHPNIVNYVDLFQYGNHLWVVMDAIADSIPLSKLLRRTSGLKEAYMANVIRNILQAVHYLHRHGIVHGNISSEQVLLDTSQTHGVRLKLCAMIMDPDSSPSQRLAAPETREGKIGPEVDIWSLGILGIEMWDCTIDLNQERVDLLLQVLKNATPPTAHMRSFLNQALEVNPAFRPTAAKLLQHSFLSNIEPKRNVVRNTTGLIRSLTDPKQRSREGVGMNRSRTAKK